MLKYREPSTTSGTGISESSVSFQFITNIMIMMPNIRNSCTTASCVIRSRKLLSVLVSPLIRETIEPVLVLS